MYTNQFVEFMSFPHSCFLVLSFLSSFFFFLPFLCFFSVFPVSFRFSAPFLPFFSVSFKKIAEKFCRCSKSSYLCTRFPQGERMKFFDRLRTHQSYSRLLGLLLAIWSRVDSFILDIYRHAIEQDSLAGQTSFIPFPLFFAGRLGSEIHTYLQ